MITLEGSVHDQVNPEGHDDPYWEIARRIPVGFIKGRHFLCDSEWHEEAGVNRYPLCQRYSWSILSPSDRTWMAEQTGGRSIVEIGAGSGYWAWQLAQGGIDVIAYDPAPVGQDNRYCAHGPYFPVWHGSASCVRYHQDRVLLMVWPPKGGSHAAMALSMYEGEILVYAGLPAGRCTADEQFYSLLEQEWDMVSVAEGHVSWCNAQDSLAVFRRRKLVRYPTVF